MSGIRTSRTRRVRRARLATAAATVAIAAFSLTACSDGAGVKDEGASAASSTSPTPVHDASPVSDAKPAASGSKQAASTPAASAPAGQSAAKPATKPTADTAAAAKPAASRQTSAKRTVCDGSNTRTVAAPVNRPVNHMLLTVTNTGSTTCDLYYYPSARFGEAQSVPPVIEDSQPQAVVSLAPGESGYAGVTLSATDGSGTNGYWAKSLSVYFSDAKGAAGYNGKSARPSLPAKGVWVDSTVKVTYWQSEMDDALMW
ncbi:DUF4232 domain-containing protein [Streptomyces sp. NPDC046939]|uniref:DUF4232 domain-containing protein n=1 Tax=Streptomyces sp. NPDC046939 TaxID=3155376 RepID=UPI0033F4C759